MELNHVASILLVTLALTFTLTRALPYPAWMTADSEASAGQEDHADGMVPTADRMIPADYMPALDRLRLYVALKVLRQQMDHSSDNDSNDSKEVDQSQTDDKGESYHDVQFLFSLLCFLFVLSFNLNFVT